MSNKENALTKREVDFIYDRLDEYDQLNVLGANLVGSVESVEIDMDSGDICIEGWHSLQDLQRICGIIQTSLPESFWEREGKRDEQISKA